MKITFILPGIGKKQGDKYIKTWKMEPLTIATLKALTPQDIETAFYDDRVEIIDYNDSTNAVMISVETYTAARAYKIAGEYRKRGVKVIFGGYHPTLMQDEASSYSDSIVVGNAESIWTSVIEDLKRGCLKPFYQGQTQYSLKLPDRSIYGKRKYLPLNLIETGRGCPFKCEFCAISSYYKSCYIPRDVKSIVTELEMTKHKYTFFVDDNIVANPGYAKTLFEEITPHKIKWTGQGALTMARDKELLKKMKKSGCDALLIGFESLDEANLIQMKKDWSYKLGEIDELIERIHGEGISIYATFVFGFDHDTRDSFKRALDFSLKHGFFFTAFNHLLPFPGTPLYQRLKDEKRLIKENWWLEPDYKYGDIPYLPKNLEPEELSALCAQSRRKFFEYSSIIKRWTQLLGRSADPLLTAIFLSQNVKMKFEVDEKLRIPVGRGLDELPK